MRIGNCSREILFAFVYVSSFLSIVKGKNEFGKKALYRNNTALTSGLYWNNLSVRTVDGTFLLHDFSGHVENGHLCGILGPSGAGKSTALAALGRTTSSSSRLQISGEVFSFDRDLQMKRAIRLKGGRIAWLQQEDHFFDMLSVWETLQLASFLEMPDCSKKETERRVVSIMESLGLVKLKNRKIGNSSSNNGLSGGEKRRLSLALEMVSSPNLALFLGDEVTSGLDSTTSKKVVGLIKELIHQRNIPCIVSLHQPQSSIFKMLNSLILLGPGGHVCYHGKASDALSYFARLGYPCPEQTNPAEFLLDLVSVDSEDPRQASEDELRVSQLATTFAQSQRLFHLPIPLELDNSATNFFDSKVTQITSSRFRKIRRFGSLLLRSWRQNIRNHRVNIFRLIASCGNAYLFSRIFHSIKKGIFTAKSVADRVALLSFSVINMSMMALMKTIDLFAKEKPVVQREQQRNQYTSLEYLLAKAIAEIPLDTVFAAIFTSTLKFLCGLRIELKALTGVFTLMTVAGASLGFAIGALSPTGEVAVVAGIPIMVVMMAVGIINPAGVDQSEPQPIVVRTLKELSPIAFAIKALCLAEYRGMEFQDPRQGEKRNIVSLIARSRNTLKELPKMGALALVQNGDQVLNELGLADENYLGAMKHLGMLSMGNLFLSWIGLKIQANANDSSSDAKNL